MPRTEFSGHQVGTSTDQQVQPAESTRVSTLNRPLICPILSRGIGRATAEALVAEGVTVVGTSRDAANAPNPPTSFTLLDLDVTSDASVEAFATNLENILNGGSIDILINNAGRYVGGLVVPPSSPNGNQLYIDQLNLGMETNYTGQIRVTNRLLPLMTAQGYARILYTSSVAGYLVGGGATGSALGVQGLHVYYSTKAALRTYVNNLRGDLAVSGSHIKVSSVNPFIIDTELPFGHNPIWTEPVDSNNDPLDPTSLARVSLLRTFQSNGLPVSTCSDTFLQLLQVNEPLPNVVVASPVEPGATAGGNALIMTQAEEENEQSALPFFFGVPGC